MPEDTPTIHITVATPPLQGDPAVIVQVSSPAGPMGPQGMGPAVLHLTLEEYLSLPPEEQIDGTWYVILPNLP